MKRILFLFTVFFMLSFSLFACKEKGLNFDEIDIDELEVLIESEYDVPAGTYQINEQIQNVFILILDYGVTFEYEVTDQDNQMVTLDDDSFTIEVDHTYTVKVRAILPNDEYKDVIVTVKAVESVIEYQITFDLQGGSADYSVVTVASGNYLLEPVTSPTKDQAEFIGWYIDQELTTLYDFSQVVTHDFVLHAGWTEIIPVYTVNFHLNGGTGNIASQSIELNGYIHDPNFVPEREGFIFTGWCLDEFLSTPIDFETYQVSGDTTLYASWAEVVTYEVTYDLNGAFQSELIVESVIENHFALGPEIVPVYSGYLFMGWSTSASSSIIFDLSNEPIISNITLYAVWQLDYLEIDGPSYFGTPEINDASIIDLGYIVQISHHDTLFLANHFESEQDINQKLIGYGMIYGELDQTLNYFNQELFKVETINNEGFYTLTDIYLSLDTYPLEQSTDYQVRYFFRYENTIVYSDIYLFSSLYAVEEGTSVGIDILSGSLYYIDNGTESFPPLFWYNISEGYEAIDNGVTHTEFANISKEGYHRVVVKNVETQMSYLHVYFLEFKEPHVNQTLNRLNVQNSSFYAIFRPIFLYEDTIDYDIDDAGVIFSSSIPFLKLDMPKTTHRRAEFDDDYQMYKTVNSYTPVDLDEPFYLRSYVVIGGDIHYSNYVYKITYDSELEYYLPFEIITVYEELLTPEYGIEIYQGEGVNFDIYQPGEDAFIKTTYTNYAHLQTVGEYFIYHESIDVLYNYVISDLYQDLYGFEDGQAYDTVLIEYMNYNPYIYYAFNGGEYLYLGNSVRFSKPGEYVIYYQTPYGIESKSFTII